MIRVTCAVIRDEDEKVLVVQRGKESDHPMKWEFPGGKQAANETEEECIVREIREELSMDIVICKRMSNVEYDYGKKHILLIPFICDTLDELPILSEHIDFKWLAPSELKNVDFSEADIPVSEEYLLISNVDTDIGIVESRSSVVPQFDDAELKSMITNTMGTKEADWIAASAIDNPVIFRKLLEYSFSSDKKLAFHSSWALSKVCDKYPESIYPFLHEIVVSLVKLDNESAERSFLRILSLTDMERVSPKDHGILADHCFSALKSGFTAIAIKAYSMEILYRLATIYPELANEISATIHMLQGEGSAGIIARGLLILKKLAEMPVKPGSSLS
jgi:8-oxo-dGTP diphosphatase